MSSVESEILMVCSTCGASVYREHVHRGLAGMWGGRMLCPTCIKPKREGVPPEPAAETLDSIPLAAETPNDEADTPASMPQSTQVAACEPEIEEPSASSRAGARHVKTFHAKLSEAALRHMDEQVNAWLQQHPSTEIRFANTTVGMFEGKHAEPNLILTLFY